MAAAKPVTIQIGKDRSANGCALFATEDNRKELFPMSTFAATLRKTGSFTDEANTDPCMRLTIKMNGRSFDYTDAAFGADAETILQTQFPADQDPTAHATATAAFDAISAHVVDMLS